jgi:hypothetical protein
MEPPTMPTRTTILFTIAAFAVAPVFGASKCESLTTLKLKNTAITLAEPVAAGAFSSPLPAPKGKQPQSFPNPPAFCRVAATLTAGYATASTDWATAEAIPRPRASAVPLSAGGRLQRVGQYRRIGEFHMQREMKAYKVQ